MIELGGRGSPRSLMVAETAKFILGPSRKTFFCIIGLNFPFLIEGTGLLFMRAPMIKEPFHPFFTEMQIRSGNFPLAPPFSRDLNSESDLWKPASDREERSIKFNSQEGLKKLAVQTNGRVPFSKRESLPSLSIPVL